MILLAGGSPLGQLDLSVENLRSADGLLQVCVTREARPFPDCDGDPGARRLTESAARPGRMRFTALPSGAYAVAVIHDENGNGRLDTRFGLPTEGFGFSRNPQSMFGPPAFSRAEFAVGGTETGQTVKLRYLF